MANIQLKDASGTSFYFEVSGDGSAGNPFIPLSELSVAGVPVAASSPVPIETPDGKGIALKDILVSLKNILNAVVRPMWVDPGTSRVKADVVVGSGLIGTVTTVTTVSTVGTVSNQSQMAGFDIKQTLLYATDRNLWSNSVRPRIT